MSNARAKAEDSHYKDLKQGVVEAKPHPIHSKKDRPYRIVGTIWKAPGTIGHYATLRDAEKALESFQKKQLYTDLYIEGPGVNL